MKIQSFDQAKQCVRQMSELMKELGEFLDLADHAISAVDMLKGHPAKPAVPPLSNVAQNGTPQSVADRVLAILHETGAPMRPKEVVDAYERKGWPRPEDRRQFYTMVSSSLMYLTKRRKKLVNTDAGYTFANN